VALTGCTEFHAGTTPPPHAIAYGSCTWHGKRLTIYTVASTTGRRAFFTAMTASGIVPARVAVAGLVVVAPEDLARLGELRRLLG
jgi:hypothetical protein